MTFVDSDGTRTEQGYTRALQKGRPNAR
jgi:hypothetical protein